MFFFSQKSKVKFQQKFKASSVIAKCIYTLDFIKNWVIVKHSNNRIEKKNSVTLKSKVREGRGDNYNKINCIIDNYQRKITIMVIQKRINGKKRRQKLDKNIPFKNIITIQIWFDST